MSSLYRPLDNATNFLRYIQIDGSRVVVCHIRAKFKSIELARSALQGSIPANILYIILGPSDQVTRSLRVRSRAVCAGRATCALHAP